MKTPLLLKILLLLLVLALPSTLRSSDSGKVQEIEFSDHATLTGRLERIKTYDEKGMAVFPFFITTDVPIFVHPERGFAPADSDRDLNGLEVKMLEGGDEVLEQFNGKRVTNLWPCRDGSRVVLL